MATAPVTRPQVELRRADGAVVGARDLDPDTFGIEPNVSVMHQVVTAQLAAARSGTQSTKTRAEVSGGGAKPWRQKGTGRARQGSNRAPQWAGGGVALGPKPRSYAQRTPKKMVSLALRSALSDRAADGKVIVLEDWALDRAKTRDAVALLAAVGADGKVLVVVRPDDETATLSFRNLPEAKVILASELNAYDVLCSDWVVFTEATVPGGLGTTAGATTAAAPASTAPAPEASTPEAPAAPAASAPAASASEPTDTEPTDAELPDTAAAETDTEEAAE